MLMDRGSAEMKGSGRMAQNGEMHEVWPEVSCLSLLASFVNRPKMACPLLRSTPFPSNTPNTVVIYTVYCLPFSAMFRTTC